MVNLNKMYDGVVNSPETYLTQNLAAEATIIYIADSSVFGSLPNLAVIGTDQNAETILIKSKRSDGGLEVQRALEGPAKRWEKTTAIARNFTNFDYKNLKENIKLLNRDKAERSEVKTKLSEMAEDPGHRTVTDTEKSNWNKKISTTDIVNNVTSGGTNKVLSAEQGKKLNYEIVELDKKTKENRDNIGRKFELPPGKENEILIKTSSGAEFKNISFSRSATFVIANYDSSENSKNGADYVIKESECAAEIINSFITKLPEYGGKIQLTEGNFNIKKNVAIELNKNNIVLEGYGQATHIIDKQTKEQRSNKIIIISIGVENCQISNLKITHETSNSISNMGNKNLIKNINITNNGTNVPICIEEKTEENILKNCRVKGDSSYCFWTADSGTNHQLTNCKGTGNFNAFYIEGTNHQLLNCSGAGDVYAFFVKGTNHQLLNCSGAGKKGNFIITGTKCIIVGNIVNMMQSPGAKECIIANNIIN